MIDPARCETHRVVLTSSGACLLCERRVAERSTGSALRKLAAVAGALVLIAASYRAWGMVRDAREERARAERIAAERIAAERVAAVAPVGTGAGTSGISTSTSTSALAPAPATTSAVTIDLYGEGWCPSCRKARAWLDAQGIAYTYRDTSDAENKRTMRALNPQSTIPTINIDGRILVGFSAHKMQSTIQAAARARAER